MGKDVSPAAPYLWPDQLNFANLRDPAVISKVAGIVPADIYLAINYRAEYYLASGLAISGIGAGDAKMRIFATITAMDSQGQYHRTATVVAESDETTPYAIAGIDPAAYPRLIVSAQKKLLPKIAAEIATW